MAALRYTLRRIDWRKTNQAVRGRPPDYLWFRLPGTARVATFHSAEEAESERHRLEAEARAAINPFRCGPCLRDRTSLDEGRLCDWLLDQGLTPPDAQGRDWVKWYDESRAAMGDLQREKVWEALDLVRFYEVVEGPVRPLVYVVAEIPWERTPECYLAHDEGGVEQRVFRTRTEAARFCRGKYLEWKSESSSYDMTDRQRLRKDPLGLRTKTRLVSFSGDDDIPRYDVLAVEAMDLMARAKSLPAVKFPAKLFLVRRPGWAAVGLGRGALDLRAGNYIEGGVPAAAFSDRASAEAHAAELNRRLRLEMSPAPFLGEADFRHITSHDEDEWLRRAESLGVAPPGPLWYGPPGARDWRAWLDGLGDAHRAAIWELCDRVELFRVVEVAAGG
jgi:hypothetical protein